MTVATQRSKTDPQVMGAYTYDFGFERLSQDPTAEDAKKAIKVAISDGTTETILEYGKDYSVDLGTSGIGGTVTVTDPKDSSWTLIVYREYSMTQGSEYRDYNAFPAPTLESNMDKTLMLLQQVQEQVDRAPKVNMTSSVDPYAIIGYVERINQSIDNIDTVSENIVSVDTVSDNIDDVNITTANISDVNIVAANISSVNNVSANMASIKAVEGNAENINAAVANESNINSVAANSANINTVAANAEAINDVHNNMPAVLDAPTQAQNAASSATAAAGSASAAAGSAAAAEQSELKAEIYAQRTKSEGIPMSVIEQKRIETSGNTVKLWWQDPRDTIIDGYVLASWASTTIVKKQGSYPEDVDDGTVVATVTTRNQYLDSPLTDTQENPGNWYYRAFPLSVNGVYCLDKRNCFGVVLFGYRINETDPVPSTRVEYLPYCDNYFYDPCIMDFVSDTFNWGSWRNAFFIPKPCALKYDGTVEYYLNPDNFTLKEDGTASDVANSSYGGNFMCEFPAIFIKVFKENNYINVLFSNVKLDDDFECWSCKKSDGTYASNFYLPMFEGTNIDSKLRSIATTGKPTASTNAETEATLATANGTGWNTTLWADEMLMMLLFPLLFKSTDSQSTLGYGGSGSTSALTVNNNAAVSKGLMYGTSAGSAYGINYLGLHNWYGHRWRRPNGLMNASGNIKVKMTHSTVDGSTVSGFNRTGDGYISTGVVPPAANQSYINRYEPLPGNKYGIVPKATSGSSSTFYCDGMWTNNGQLDQLIMGGSVDCGSLCGAFCFHVNSAPTFAYWLIGASLSYHHL